MRLRTLRLAGFKSFAEPLQLEVQPGLSGIVGPNGCGKSNLLEALCWGMGETSFRHMRAQNMDEVVFAGSALRPSVSAAETRLVLELASDEAPSEELAARFALARGHQIDIVRRLVRGEGSVWHVNGREARARDVQLLFADAASGARSLAFVRQGMIADLVTARPEGRRKILEEAAGVAGLYARRHEAELRLAATEHNIARLHDMLGEKTARKKALAKQARAARRYRELSDAIRRQDSLLACQRWRKAARSAAEAAAQQEADGRALRTMDDELAAAERAAGGARRAHGALEAEAAEAQNAHLAQKHRSDGMQAAAAQVQARLSDVRVQLAQLRQDEARAQSQSEDAAAQVARLAEECAALEARIAAAPRADAPDMSEDKTRAQKAMAEAQAAWDAHQADLAAARARADALREQLAHGRAEAQELEALAAQQKEALAASRAARQRAAAQKTDAAAALRARTQEDKQARTAQEKSAAAAAAQAARLAALQEDEQQWKQQRAQWQAQWETVTRLFPHAQASRDPVLAKIEIPEPYDTALAALLGEDAQAGLKGGAQIWHALSDLPPAPLPRGVRPISDFVRAPKALARLLSHVGLVEAAEGAHAQKALRPGQILVSRAGDIWRWDGYAARADVAKDKAERFRQLRRGQDAPAALKRAEKKLAELRTRIASAEAALAASQSAAEEAQRALDKAGEGARAAQKTADEAARQLSDADAQEAQARAALAHSEQELSRRQQALAETQTQLARLEAPQDDAAAQRLDARLKRARAEMLALEARALKAAPAAADKERLARLKQDESEWQARAQTLAAQHTELAERAKAGAAALSQLEREADAQAVAQREQKAAAEAAARAQSALAARLATSEAALAQSEQAARAAREQQASLRERASANRTRRDMLAAQQADAAEAIVNRFQCSAQELAERLELAEDAPLPDFEALEQALDDAHQRRDAMGEVNLLAQPEMETLETELEEMQGQVDDLTRAVGSLRRAIAAFNQESRSRMEKALREVKAHFQSLFATLFDGGEAQLRLTEPQRPLESGLDVVVRVPGKKAQSLALLSGGEQTLTALALIFAVFATNPAPICVLDEADSQLDDGNVGRFCRLLQKLAAETRTCFWLITHHPLTMSRMDRLWGVTMQEPGVSHLSAVSLKEAEAFAEFEDGRAAPKSGGKKPRPAADAAAE